ncbi:MAG: sigma-70 family RNA polymerase sigma factor [Actinomycetia bacterium]|nr:sigma-70 family RNA polymerase sigma factor [Actinomycetes bacterium]
MTGVAVLSLPVTDGRNTWDRQLVARMIAGDDSALADAYDQFSALVYGIAQRTVGPAHASDITQEVFVALWQRPEGFDPLHGSLRTYLATIARRRCVDHLRRSGRRVANEERSNRAEPARTPNVDEAALALIAGEQVRRALSALPKEQRTAIELAYLQGLTFRQVADATGASEGTAKSRIRLGLQRLADQLRGPETMECV